MNKHAQGVNVICDCYPLAAITVYFWKYKYKGCQPGIGKSRY